MTNDEYTNAQAQIANAETEIAALTQAERDCIEKAREFNDACKVARNKRTGLVKAIEPLRIAVRQHQDQLAIEAKRLANEQAKAEAERRAKQEAEQAAAREQTELEKLRAENAELKAKIVEQA